MKPRKMTSQEQDDFFKVRLTDLINPSHPLFQS